MLHSNFLLNTEELLLEVTSKRLKQSTFVAATDLSYLRGAFSYLHSRLLFSLTNPSPSHA